MKLWLITTMDDVDWDTYDSLVVAANTEEEAKYIHPGDYGDVFDKNSPNDWLRGWTTPDRVKVKYIGEAKKGTKIGVICAIKNHYE